MRLLGVVVLNGYEATGVVEIGTMMTNFKRSLKSCGLNGEILI